MNEYRLRITWRIFQGASVNVGKQPASCACRTRWTLNLEFISVKTTLQIYQHSDDRRIDRHPRRSSPVGISAEHSGVRFGLQVPHMVLLIAHQKHERMIQVIPQERTDSVRPQKLVLVEQVTRNPPQFLLSLGSTADADPYIR